MLSFCFFLLFVVRYPSSRQFDLFTQVKYKHKHKRISPLISCLSCRPPLCSARTNEVGGRRSDEGFHPIEPGLFITMSTNNAQESRTNEQMLHHLLPGSTLVRPRWGNLPSVARDLPHEQTSIVRSLHPFAFLCIL
jgi:hypothetical protein